jgi:hypothetical protein
MHSPKFELHSLTNDYHPLYTHVRLSITSLCSSSFTSCKPQTNWLYNLKKSNKIIKAYNYEKVSNYFCIVYNDVGFNFF